MSKATSLLHVFNLELRRIALGKAFIAEVDVTDNCNLRCAHCYHFHGKRRFAKEEVPLDEWKRRFEILHGSGIRGILLVGGEPALRQDVLMLADRMFAYVFTISNGTIRICDEFNHRIFVSIDGSPRTNDSIRGKGVFSRVIENYAGDKRVVINMTVTRENYRELETVINIARENGFAGAVCNIFTPCIGDNGNKTLSKDERRVIVEELRRVKSLYPDTFLLTSDMIRWYEIPDHRDSCYWGDKTLHFDVSWNRRRCFANVDCSNCGCFAGAMQNPVKLALRPKAAKRIGFV